MTTNHQYKPDTYRSQAARTACIAGYGGPSYWTELDDAADRHAAYFTEIGRPDMAELMFTRSLSEALMGNDGI